MTIAVVSHDYDFIDAVCTDVTHYDNGGDLGKPCKFVYYPMTFSKFQRLKPEIVEAYRQTIHSGILEDYDAVDKGLIALGARNPSGPPVDFDFYKKWRDLFLLPFTSEEPFDYGASTIHDDAKRMIPEAFKRIASFQPAVEIVFIDRVIVGQYGNLRTIRPKGKFLDLVMPYIDPPAA